MASRKEERYKPSMEAEPTMRIDKWLWAVRLYRTRSLAAAACTHGRVRINDQPVKPARSVRPGESLTAVTGDITRQVKVLALLNQRIPATLVPQYLEDLTPPEEYQKRREPTFKLVPLRPKGAGRPTKKERRDLNDWLGDHSPGGMGHP